MEFGFRKQSKPVIYKKGHSFGKFSRMENVKGNFCILFLKS